MKTKKNIIKKSIQKKNNCKESIILDSGEGGNNFRKLLLYKNKSCKINLKKINNGNILSKNTFNYIKEVVNSKIKFYSLKKKKIIIACHTAVSTIYNDLIKNNFVVNNCKIYEPILPTCKYIKKHKFKNILIFSTSITKKIGIHKKMLPNLNIKYIKFDNLADDIEKKNYKNINILIKNLNKKKEIIKKYDCIVLGCTHYNVLYLEFLNFLKNINFEGKLVNTNEILVNNFLYNK